MCNIAGYIGDKQAAPVLIDMMLREEGFDAGFYTGISTIHEGKLYYAKLMGDTKRLLDLTNAASLPGHIGIIHGRTRSGGDDMWAHPFIAEREGIPYLAYVANGSTGCFADRKQQALDITEQLVAEGYHMHSRAVMPPNHYLTLADGTSVHSSDATSQLVLRNLLHGIDLPDAMEQALCGILSEDVALALSLSDPDCIGFTRINQPMMVSFVEHGVYMASTAMAFPSDAGDIQSLPLLSSGRIYRTHLTAAPYQNPPCLVKDIDDTIRQSAYDLICQALQEQKYTLGQLRQLIKPIFGNAQSAPFSFLVYEILRELQTEGRLQTEKVRVNGVREGITAPQIQMWL